MDATNGGLSGFDVLARPRSLSRQAKPIRGSQSSRGAFGVADEIDVSELKVKIFADGANKAGMLEMYAKPYIRG